MAKNAIAVARRQAAPDLLPLWALPLAGAMLVALMLLLG